MAKKPIEEKHEFVKFIKELYTEDIQFNFDSYFVIKCGSGPKFNLYFPDNDYYHLIGSIDLSDCPKLCEWLSTEENKYVVFDNDKVDELRKLIMSDFVSLEVTDETYKINCTNKSYEFNKISSNSYDYIKPFEIEFSASISADDIKNKSVLIIYYDKKSKNITFDDCQENEIIFESPIKNFKNIYKKDANYTIYISVVDGEFRIASFEGVGKYCLIAQCFKIINSIRE